MRRIAVGLAIVVTVVVVMAATAPHDWVGKLWCGIQGGEWTNRYRSAQEEIVTAGRRCVK